MDSSFLHSAVYIYKRRKKAKQLKAEGKLPYGKTYLGCSLPLLIFLLCIFLAFVLYIIFPEPILNWVIKSMNPHAVK